MLHRTTLVAIGSNLPGPAGQTPRDACEWAIKRLCRLPGLQLDARSRWYRSAPVPPSGQPDYVNGAVRLQGDVEPAALLAALHAIEADAGRTRSALNAARTLDLDLLAMNDLVQPGPPVLPHPRLHERAFVLLPLLDIAPGWVHPEFGKSVAELAAGVDTSGCEPFDIAALASPDSSP